MHANYTIIRDPPIMLKSLPIMLCCNAQNFARYAQIMLPEIEQFPNIYSTILMHCLQIFTFISIWSTDYESLLDKYNFIEKIDILY